MQAGSASGKTGSGFDTIFPVVYASVYLLVSLGVHLAFFPIGDTGVESDFYGELVLAAQKLWKGDFSVASYPYKGPLYSFVLVFIRIFVGDWYRSGVVLNLLCAAGSLIVLYRLLLRIFKRHVAIFATVSASLVFEFFLASHKASSDMLFFLLCYLAIGFLIMDAWSWMRLVAAGVMSALAFLTRYNGLFLPAGALIILLLVNPTVRVRKRRLSAAAVYVVAFLGVCLPWFVLSFVQTGSFIATRNLENIVGEFYGGERASLVPDGGFRSILSLVAHDPVYFSKHYLLNIPRHFWKDMYGTLGLPVGILVMLGMLQLPFVSPSKKHWALYTFAGCYFLSMCAVFHLRRLSLPLVPVYCAIGFSFVFEQGVNWRSGRGLVFARILSRVTGNRVIVTVVVAGLLVFQAAKVFEHESLYYKRRPLFIADAALFLKAHAIDKRKDLRPVVMARKPHIAYYSGMQYQEYPRRFDGSLHEFIAFGISRDVDYIVFSVIEREYYRDYYFLTNLDAAPGINRIYEKRDIVIYELSKWLDISSAAGKRALGINLSLLEEAEKERDPSAVLSACYNIMGLYAVNGDWEKMSEYLIRGLNVVGMLPDTAEAAKHANSLRRNLSQAYLRLGKHREGIALMKEEIENTQVGRGENNLAGAYILLARHYEKLGEYKEALSSLRIASDFYRSFGNERQAVILDKYIERLEARDMRGRGQ